MSQRDGNQSAIAQLYVWNANSKNWTQGTKCGGRDAPMASIATFIL
jgi:hypothetical protein